MYKTLKKIPLSIYLLLFSLIFFITLLNTFTFFWETNDDLAMSMYAHGYGIARQGSPLLVFSNYIWGYLIYSLPTLNGIVPYSWFTILIIFLCLWSITYQLTLLGANRSILFYITILTFTKIFIYPQFTITAGILTLNGILGWYTFLNTNQKRFIYIALISFLLGFLVRDREFFMIFVCGLIFLDWHKLIKSKKILLSLLLLVIICPTLDYINTQAYKHKEWEKFNNLNSARLPFTDYQAGYTIKKNPELLKKHGFSENDVRLIENWFFVDLKVASAKRLNALLTASQWKLERFADFITAFKSLKVLLVPELLPLVIFGMLMFFFCDNKKKLILAWLFLICIIFFFGVLGRPGTTRVYFPILTLILFFSLLSFSIKNIAIAQFIVSLFAIISSLSISHYYYKNYMDRGAAQVVARDVRRLHPKQLYIAWGARYPYELAYPVLKKVDFEKGPKFYSFGVSTLSPHISTNWPYRWYKHFLHRLLKDPYIPMVASENNIQLLSNYCAEHHRRKLKADKDPKFVKLDFYWINCLEPLK